MSAEPEATILVASFANAASAEDARVALERSGIDPDAVTIVQKGQLNGGALAALTGTSAGDWDASRAESLVLVSVNEDRRTAERILREQGAEDVLASAATFAEPPIRAGSQAAPVPPPVEPGMTVMSADRREVGRVKELGNGAILVARPLRPDVWVPLTAVDHIVDQWVLLTIPFLEIDVAASFLLKH
jgi:hypothetical protein